MSDDSFGVSCKFQLSIGYKVIGQFTSCEGLGATLEMEEYEEGGLNNHVWQLPTRIRYDNIVLSRPLTWKSILGTAWLELQNVPHLPSTARSLPGWLFALSPDNKVITGWILNGCVPIKWTAPSFSADRSEPAYETLEITYDGFYPIPYGSA